jgi:hypothetical protein
MDNDDLPSDIECPNCGSQQPDMGKNIKCENCDEGPMPYYENGVLIEPQID